jgi:hypothetical protein
MALAYADLIAVYPEFTTSSGDAQTRINTAIGVAEAVVYSGVLRTSSLTTTARLALAAHLTSLYSRGCNEEYNGTGAMTGRTRGDRSVSYESPPTYLEEGILKSTLYGVQYLLLMRGGRHRRPLVGM